MSSFPDRFVLINSPAEGVIPRLTVLFMVDGIAVINSIWYKWVGVPTERANGTILVNGVPVELIALSASPEPTRTYSIDSGSIPGPFTSRAIGRGITVEFSVIKPSTNSILRVEGYYV